MLRLFLVLALAGAIFASPSYPPYFHNTVSTRADCVPEGFTAISASWDLSHLPAYGKYVICLTQTEFDNLDTTAAVDFTVQGTFKLSHSTLIVDRNIRIVADYPSRLDWEYSVVSELAAGDPALGIADWAGVVVSGAPTTLVHPGYLHSTRYGNCGRFVHVSLEETLDFDVEASFIFTNCSGLTQIDHLTILNDDSDNTDHGIFIQDSQGLIFTDLVVVMGDSDDGDCVRVTNSQVAFVRPILYSENDDAIEVIDGSNITVCDGILHSDVADHDYFLGGDTPNKVAVAGIHNSHFPSQVTFEEAGGILYTLARCPSSFKGFYDGKLWQEWFSSTTNP